MEEEAAKRKNGLKDQIRDTELIPQKPQDGRCQEDGGSNRSETLEMFGKVRLSVIIGFGSWGTGHWCLLELHFNSVWLEKQEFSLT